MPEACAKLKCQVRLTEPTDPLKRAHFKIAFKSNSSRQPIELSVGYQYQWESPHEEV